MSASPPEAVEPFLKWAGGKRWLAPALAELVDEHSSRRYFEPFLGGGAVFFALQRRGSVLSDVNNELVNAYRVVRQRPHQLMEILEALPINRRTFYSLRRARPQDSLDRAARFLYLNRTAFNGLWRVNRRGEFNVPFGCKPGTRLYESDRIVRCARALRGMKIGASDFRLAVAHAGDGDAVYLDPPYTTAHNNNGFRRYNEGLFSWGDQCRLASLAADADARGAFVLVTNARHDVLRDLYPRDRFVGCTVVRRARMAAAVEYRRATEEVVIASRWAICTATTLVEHLRLHGLDAKPLRLS